jgi:hypothetical protein
MPRARFNAGRQITEKCCSAGWRSALRERVRLSASSAVSALRDEVPPAGSASQVERDEVRPARPAVSALRERRPGALGGSRR